jgi:hypothetical protein
VLIIKKQGNNDWRIQLWTTTFSKTLV